MATANATTTTHATVIDDTVKKTISKGDKGVAIANPSVFEGDLRKIKPPQKWLPGDAVKVANPRHIRDIQTIKPAVNKVAGGMDPLLEKQSKVKTSKSTNRSAVVDVNVDGLGFNGVNPPDTTGDVGLKYYIQSINSGGGSVFNIYDKTDGAVVAGPISMASLATGDCANTMGDPIVLFDEQAKRWLLTEFSTQGVNKLCVLVSKTEDPIAGGWYSYEFQAPSFPDYPKYSQMGGVYYASANENQSAVYAFEREKMLAGEPAAMIRQEVPTLAGFGFNAITPIDVDGDKAAPAGTPGMFIRHRDDELHNAGSNNAEKDYLEIWTLTPDFANSDNSKLEGPFNIEVTEFDSNFRCDGPGFGCLEQKGSDQPLDPLREVVMYKAQYRHFDGHESIVGNFITKTSENIAALRWFELRRTGDSDWAVNQEGTYSENDNKNRYMGASAMDGDGNIAIAYMLTGKEQYPSLAFNGRYAGDEAGTLTFGETMLMEGAGAIQSDRDGDYSQMGVDPVDNCTMWFTAEYGGADGQWGTRVTSFKVPSCGDPNPGFTLTATNLKQEVCANGDMQPINVNASGYNDFGADIKLSFVNLPDGITGSFSADTIKPGVATVANISIAQDTAAGDYNLEVTGTSDGAKDRSFVSKLKLMDTTSTATLVQPADNSVKVALYPTFNWDVDGRASVYVIEVATDAEFSNIVVRSEVSGGNSYRPSEHLAQETVYYWRVTASNSCGEKASAVGKFTTGSEKDGAKELAKDATSEAFSGETNTQSFFYIDVPEGATDLKFTVSADNGDADLYVSKDMRPQQGVEVLCLSESPNSEEACTVEGDVQGTYFALVNAYDTYSAATITATYTGGVSGPAITGQKDLSVTEDNALAITPTDLTVEDVDYPTGYTLAVLDGENYSFDGNTVTPATDFYGELSVNVKVNDGSLDSAVYELKIQVIGVNDAPVISATELITVDEDMGWTLDASLITVVDSDSTDFTFTLAAGDHYTIDGDTVVMPDANYNGVLNVGVTVNDGHVDSEASSIQITVNPVNDEPVLVNDSATVKADSSNNVINVLGNDSDVDEGDTITLESVAYTGTGSATVVGSNISYTPAAGFKGTETFEYTAKDSAGALKTASVTVTVEDTSNHVQLSSSGGSMSGFVYLMLLPLVALRRRFKIRK